MSPLIYEQLGNRVKVKAHRLAELERRVFLLEQRLSELEQRIADLPRPRRRRTPPPG